MRTSSAGALLLLGLSACSGVPTSSGQLATLNYVALGDSYTIGTAVSPDESWPSQLAERVPQLRLVENLGRNGYTSADVLGEEVGPLLGGDFYQFVTLLVGVNDVVNKVPEVIYRAQVGSILDGLLGRVPADRILCIATPDYTVMPQGTAFGSPARQRAGIERVNAILGDACKQRGVRFVPEIFEISQEAASDPSLVARDGLHPSGAQYKLWVDAIQPVVEEMLAQALPSADR